MFILSTGQIIITELLLGILSLLYISALIVFNIIISGTVFVILINKKINVIKQIKNDIKQAKSSLLQIISAENTFLLLLMLIVTVWMILAACYLPPRGVDDLVYHVPEIFEYIQSHSIKELPQNIRINYAYPHNAELLFLWPTIFFHNVVPLGLVQYFIAIFGCLVIYSLARNICVSKKISFFVAIQFIFIPVVLAQSGSAYIDIITSVFLLASVYLAVMYYKKPSCFSLFCAAAAIGLMSGMKYSMLIAMVSLQFLVFPKLWKTKKLLVFYFFTIIFFGGYWYLKNILVYKSPIYPIDIFDKNFGIFNDNISGFSDKFYQLMPKFFELFFCDAGLGSLHGGYGITFWGICLPSLGYVFVEAMQAARNKEYENILFWGQSFICLIIFFFVPLKDFYLYPRLCIFLVGFGLVALGRILHLLEGSIYKIFIIMLCCIFSVLAVSHLSLSKIPSYEIDIPIKDIAKHKNVSKYKYLRLSPYMLELTQSWELLDLLTKDKGKGLSCYYEADFLSYWTTPIYGSKIQNKVWNFQKHNKLNPEAFLFYHSKKKKKYLNNPNFSVSKIFFNTNHELILKTKKSLLFVDKKYIETNNSKEALAVFYKDYYSNEIEIIAKKLDVFDPAIPIVTASKWGYAMKYFYYTKKIENLIYIIPEGWEDIFITRYEFKEIYTFGETIEGYKQEKIFSEHVSEKKSLVLFKNNKNE